jgi:hypothetical protein
MAAEQGPIPTFKLVLGAPSSSLQKAPEPDADRGNTSALFLVPFLSAASATASSCNACRHNTAYGTLSIHIFLCFKHCDSTRKSETVALER